MRNTKSKQMIQEHAVLDEVNYHLNNKNIPHNYKIKNQVNDQSMSQDVYDVVTGLLDLGAAPANNE